MKIRVNLQIFIFIIIFIFTKQIKIYSILMLFAIIHELGHMLVGILLGFKISSIELMPFGVSIVFDVNYKNYNKKIKNGNLINLKKLLIALAGPITNLIFVIIFIISDLNLFNIENEIIVYANILICLFNLIPIYPLDGGRIIKNVLHIVFGIKKSYQYTNLISNIMIIVLTMTASILILFVKNIAILFIIIYLWILVIKQNRIYENKKRILEMI